MEELAYRGMQPVAAHGEVRSRLEQRLPGRRTLKLCDYAVRILFYRDAFTPCNHGVRTQSFDNGLEQHALEFRSMHRVLGLVVAGVTAKQLAINELTEAIEKDGFAREDRRTHECRIDPELSERFGRVRQDIDPHANRLDLRRGLVDATGDASAFQEKRKRESTDTGADDDDVQDSSTARSGVNSQSRDAGLSDASLDHESWVAIR